MSILELTPAHPLWADYCAHLSDAEQARWVLDEDNQPLQDALIFLAALDGEEITGSLTLIRQQIVIPSSKWAKERDRILRDASGTPLEETFVQTFFVNSRHRRQGHGRDLQLAALQKTRQLGCFQMRSWSSLDKPANYQLKLNLGFAFQPEIQVTPSGLKVSGGYFIRTV